MKKVGIHFLREWEKMDGIGNWLATLSRVSVGIKFVTIGLAGETWQRLNEMELDKSSF